MLRIRLIGGAAAVLLICAAPGLMSRPAAARDAQATAAPPDGLASLADLDRGADNWRFIAPHAPAAAPAGSVADVSPVAPARAHQPAPAVQPLGAHLAVAPLPPEPPPVKASLWFMQPGR